METRVKEVDGVFVGETRLRNGWGRTPHDLQGGVETLLWEYVAGSTYMDHGQTVVTIAGQFVLSLASWRETTR